MNISEDGKSVLNILIIVTFALCRKPICKQKKLTCSSCTILDLCPRDDAKKFRQELATGPETGRL